ncbi:MAG: hypothetical protein K8I30_05330, partial [Anaerolineae bacterium]|nr:hypothetical protein [Anaerolineae bacterium]
MPWVVTWTITDEALYQGMAMRWNGLRIGWIGLVLLAAMGIIVGCGPRTVYTPVNLMSGNPTAPPVVNTFPTPTVMEVANDLQASTIVLPNGQGVTYTVKAGDT